STVSSFLLDANSGRLRPSFFMALNSQPQSMAVMPIFPDLTNSVAIFRGSPNQLFGFHLREDSSDAISMAEKSWVPPLGTSAVSAAANGGGLLFYESAAGADYIRGFSPSGFFGGHPVLQELSW